MNNLKLPVKGYKVFKPDFTCRGFQFSENEEFKYDGEIEICNRGFHFCLKASHCFNYYDFNPNNIICEVEGIGEILTHSDDSKICTNHIKIGRRLSWADVLVVANEGSNNTGYSNSGNWNSGYRNSGAFCTDSNPELYLFNKPTGIKVKDWENHKAIQIMNEHFNFAVWIPASMMTEEEKKTNPKYETTDGYLKTIPIKEAWINMWGNLSDEKKNVFTTLPNFDAEIFTEITGIKTNL